MSTRLFGVSVPRREDSRFLRGDGQYLADFTLPGMAHVAVLRSPHAHAEIRGIDTKNALLSDGVIAAITHEDLGAAGRSFPSLLPHEGLAAATWCALADRRVRFVGEAVVAIVAETHFAAIAAFETINVDYAVLPPILDLEDALRPESPLVHENIPGNLAARLVQNLGNFEAEIAAAPHRITERLRVTRGAGMPMEARGVLSRYDDKTGEITVWSSTQEPHTVRDTIAVVLGLCPGEVRVISPDAGGAFGSKLNVYPEEVLIAWIAKRLRRPARWIETRSEHMLTSTRERDQIHDIEVGFDATGRVCGFRDKIVHDVGAYAPRGAAVAHNTLSALPGPYEIKHLAVEVTCVYTNMMAVSPYRGAGQPQAAFIIERTLDWIAQYLQIDPAEVRRRNIIPSTSFPYDTGLKNLLGGAVEYDSGDFLGTLELALEISDYVELRQSQKEARAAGRFVGIGLASYVELTARGPWEGGGVRLEPNGSVTVFTGASSQGQGHETTLAQICSDYLSVPMELINVRTGDTSLIAHSMGTFASRVGALVGSAVRNAASEVKRKILVVAEDLLETNASDLDITEGYIHVKGVPSRRLHLKEIAARVRPAFSRNPTIAALEAIDFFEAPKITYSNGTHVAYVEVDIETGVTSILRYFVAHDCGRVINPTIVEGQIHGGVACGIGNALLERHVYDRDGQLLTGSFMDYAMPRATDMPSFEVAHHECPSFLNPLGVRGAGEAGTIPVAAAVCGAIEDALMPLKRRIREAPVEAHRLWEIIQQGA